MGRRRAVALCARLAQSLPRLRGGAAAQPAWGELAVPAAHLHTLPGAWGAHACREPRWPAQRPTPRLHVPHHGSLQLVRRAGVPICLLCILDRGPARPAAGLE